MVHEIYPNRDDDSAKLRNGLQSRLRAEKSGNGRPRRNALQQIRLFLARRFGSRVPERFQSGRRL